MPMWTDAQARAIYEPSGEGNIIVSAAAGSGKTAVLVERIAAMVMRAEDTVSIDELLVVTFTEAAAAEMKERIIARINGAYREALSSGAEERAKYLKEQMHLTATADINTIDAFCLGVVKNNFHILGIDPNFSIMDKNESEMLMDDAMSELFAKLYASEDDEERTRFERLGRLYSKNRDDEGLKSIIRKIYNFIQSFADPLGWLNEKAGMYEEDMTQSSWINGIFLSGHRDYILRVHKPFWNDLAEKMLGIVREKYKEEEAFDENKVSARYWGKLWDNVLSCREACAVMEQKNGYGEMYEFYNTYIKKKSVLGNAIKAYPGKIESGEEEWSLYYREYDRMRDNLRSECNIFPKLEGAEFNESIHARELCGGINDIVWLVNIFSAYFEEKKTARNVKSFSDIEHLTYRLFSENENIRGEYAKRYKEILIDEFQDTNGLQDAIFTLISRDNKNIFMVGDLKQSIYRFRGGDPMIFKEKSRRYSMGDGGKRISLSQNFRSRQTVLKGINTVFYTMMSDRVGDVDYTDCEALSRDSERESYTGAAESGGKYNCEYHNISVFKEDALAEDGPTAARAEAECIAERIKEMTEENFQVYDGNGAYRDMEYRDIVILMRSVKSGDIIRAALERHNIPVFVQKEEYFERREIKLMLSLISLINNHRQDIPLTAVMRSPIGDFTDNELARIKIKNKRMPFYDALRCYSADSEDEKRLEMKCRHFLQSLDRWRGYVKMKSIASLIWTLYEETRIYDFMGALEGGEEAQANLKLLYERAKRYEESGFKGIFNFIRYIDRIGKRSDDISGARLVNESHNVVRIMTIHKSKGLEFPVVFLARAAQSFMRTPPGEERRIVLNSVCGLGIDYYNYEDMYVKPVMFTDYIRSRNDREHRSEQMRLLYVAMTRAKEKLIVTSSRLYADEEKYEEYIDNTKEACAGITGAQMTAEGADAYCDWIFPSVINGGRGWSVYEKRVSAIEYEEDEEREEEITIENPEEVRKAVGHILEFDYKYPASGRVPAKTSVTAIKEMADEEHEQRGAEGTVYMTEKPAFLRSENTGAQIGTAHHQVMAYINIEEMRRMPNDDYEEFVTREIERIAGEGQLDASIAADKKITSAICENVCAFFRSDMGREVFDAREVKRETPFEIEITACDYDPSLDGRYSSDKVVVQGIIDLYYEDKDGNIILVDYKTDRCKTEEEQLAVAERYRRQLELYRHAMEKILKRNVKDMYLYLFSVQSVVQLN